MMEAPTMGIDMIRKRDGREVPFDQDKIEQAIFASFQASGSARGHETSRKLTEEVVRLLENNENISAIPSVEQVQDTVEQVLMRNGFTRTAKSYILYRAERSRVREMNSRLMRTFGDIVFKDASESDIKRENANINGDTAMGAMLKFGSEGAKQYYEKYVMDPRFGQAHMDGDIHIHDMDFYTLTTTCCQIELKSLFKGGFSTGHGYLREPQDITSYAALACIAIQANQNDQHGGQAIVDFDYGMAPGVKKTFIKRYRMNLSRALELLLNDAECDAHANELVAQTKAENLEPTLEEHADHRARMAELLTKYVADEQMIARILDFTQRRSEQETDKATYQAMEALIHNLNTMHSRGGNQVVFSSINYGTDTSPEGRMVIEELLKATIEGLGTRGEVPVFPIQIFKVKDGVSYSEEDYKKAMENFEAALEGKMEFQAPNFDLFLKACRTTAKALFPNFMFLDTPYNKNEKWDIKDPKRYRYELATMGCRTRVYENIAGEKSSLGRGNLSFTTMNMPRLAIEARIKAESLEESGKKEAIERKAKEIFMESVHALSELIAEQLYARYQYQRTALARQFPFMMGNDVWKGGGKLSPNDQVGDVLRQGTLGIGFIGGHNAMMALYGEGHAHSQKAWDTLFEAVTEMNKVADEYKQKYQLNFSVLATPAEGLSGRFTRMDRRKYGIIPGVTDNDYYVNSFHVDVKEPITITEKIKREAPFHAITRGGHITYVELDGEAQKNVKAIAKIVKVMHDEGIGYGSINHPVDTCQACGYKGVIYDKCPVCQSENIMRMRRITGYLTGDLSTWNSAKRAEERDRVKHG
mgnify:CR=1 FL=1